MSYKPPYRITRNQLAAILRITTVGVKYHLQKMVQENIIMRHGSPRSGYWEVVNH